MSSSTLHVISWNVAGWEATLKYIKTHYKTLDAFLDRLGCDILAIQEAKVQKVKLAQEPASVAAHPFGEWESYWGVPATEGGGSSKSAAKRGFNGVTTFARKGLTVSADANPLGDASLDSEGRCLMTDHGGFVLFNVYAHATGEGDDYAVKLQRKLLFFGALRAKMSALRAAGRRVVLCGDLNVAARGADVPWKQALLPIPALHLDDDGDGNGDGNGHGHRDGPAPQLDAQEGQAETEAGAPAEEAEAARALKAVAHAAARAEAEAAVASLREALGGEAGVRSLARRLPGGGPRAQLRAGLVLRECVNVISGALCDEDGMVDTFAALRPAAVHRFTCWHQYKNQRYCNNGKRIDYFLIDGSLAAHALRGPDLVEDETEEGARRAATAGGRWLPAPTHGVLSGLQDASMGAHDTQFQPGKHTGILYTAPQASDHVAVTLLLDAQGALGHPKGAPGAAAASRGPLDAATKACSYRPQASLKSFFAPKPKRPATEAAAASSAAAEGGKKPKA